MSVVTKTNQVVTLSYAESHSCHYYRKKYTKTKTIVAVEIVPITAVLMSKSTEVGYEMAVRKIKL